MQAQPTVIEATDDQSHWFSGPTLRPWQLLITRFAAEPGSRPVFYIPPPVGPPSQWLDARRRDSIAYINDLISQYVLDTDGLKLLADLFPSGAPNLSCIIQIGDQADDFAPTIGFCTSGQKAAIIPDLHFWLTRGYSDLREQFGKMWMPWGDRAPQAFWRGSSTGGADLTLESIRSMPRFRLCDIAVTDAALRGRLDAKLTGIVGARDADEAARIHAFAERRGILAPFVPQTDFLNYRYQIDIDGNSNSWSLLIKLMMGSCVLKVGSEWRQWYYERLRPWEHYVPVKSDLSDLDHQIGWCLEHDEAARRIAENGMKFANCLEFDAEMRRAAVQLTQTSRPWAFGPLSAL